MNFVSYLFLVLTGFILESVWRRVASLSAGLFAVLASVGCILRRRPFPGSQMRVVLWPSSLVSPVLQTRLVGCAPTAVCGCAKVSLPSCAVLGFTALSWAMTGCTFKCPFSFLHFPQVLHFNLVDQRLATVVSLWATPFPSLPL